MKHLIEKAEAKSINCNNTAFGFHLKFDSVDELIKNSEQIISDGGFCKPASDDDWTFADSSRQETKKLLETGDAKDSLIDMINDVKDELELEGIADITGQVKSCKRQRRFAVDGCEIDINRVLTGEPEVFSLMKRDGKKQFVTVGINCSMSHAHGEREFARNTAVAYVTAELLESLGYGVEIRLVSCTSDNGHKSVLRKNFADVCGIKKVQNFSLWKSQFCISAVAKETDKPVDIRNVSATALTGYLRRHVFAVKHMLFGKAGGCVEKTPADMLKFIGCDLLVSSQFDKGEEYQFILKAIDKYID